MGRLPSACAADAKADALGALGWLPALPSCGGPYSRHRFAQDSIAGDSRTDQSIRKETEVGDIEMRRAGMR